ncbi:MAG: DUF4259 domain-containing protein [Phycisphaerales bacterium]|nr:MAG: DUF4259 domain-containing protein [Phycisphaerales bacterium]
MGDWGYGAFDNDDAGDWAYDLEESDDLSLVEEAIDTVLEAEGYLDAPDASVALAACEVIARLQGRFGKRDSSTETVDAWVEAHPLRVPPELVERADRAIDRIIGPESELRELWDDAGSEAWLAAVEELRGRVRG